MRRGMPRAPPARFATVGAVQGTHHRRRTASAAALRGAARRLASLSLVVLVAALATGCDRNIEPYDPDEEPREPDLSKIFPEGAERAQQQPPSLPPAPGGERGAPALSAEQMAGEPGPGSDAPPIEGRVEVAPELGGALPPDAVLFIIARRASGGPPLAVKRVAGPAFPLAFSLGPDDRMIQSMPFVGPIRLSARLDGDGNAMSRSPGDLQGELPEPLDPGATGVVVRLDTRL